MSYRTTRSFERQPDALKILAVKLPVIEKALASAKRVAEQEAWRKAHNLPIHKKATIDGLFMLAAIALLILGMKLL